ncbi:EAL domain-containing protein [Endozoicomonas sp. SM1973]|uniref:EAL domain-containing protein n=1 Tax=Spartinivicinus marinus TaxID=2994442 RepID=A0A853I057_9GAMM|nr:EAL domain-containing protein [Spartinivicinus marinus]
MGISRKFPFDIIKVDRSFISNRTNSNRDQELVRTIITMAHKLLS